MVRFVLFPFALYLADLLLFFNHFIYNLVNHGIFFLSFHMAKLVQNLFFVFNLDYGISSILLQKYYVLHFFLLNTFMNKEKKGCYVSKIICAKKNFPFSYIIDDFFFKWVK